MQASLAKRITQLVWRHGERRERGRWLGYEKTEAFGELGRDQIAEGPIIGQDEQAHERRRFRRGRAARGVAEDHAQLGLEIQTERLVTDAKVIVGTEQAARGTLVDERLAAQGLRWLHATRFAHEQDVIDERRTVDPFVRAR